MQHAINWFDLPAIDIRRAVKFYNAIFDISMTPTEMSGETSAFFPADDGGVGGAITQGEWFTPSDTAGPLIYLNAGNDLAVVLDRVEAAGGKVVVPKMPIPPHGCIGVFIDSEGNRVGLHSIH